MVFFDFDLSQVSHHFGNSYLIQDYSTKQEKFSQVFPLPLDNPDIPQNYLRKSSRNKDAKPKKSQRLNKRRFES